MSRLLRMKKTRTTVSTVEQTGRTSASNHLELFDEIYLRKSKRLGSGPLYLLTYKSSKLLKWFQRRFYFAQDLPIDLLRSNLSKTEEVGSPEDYLRKVKRKLEELFKEIRKQIDIKSSLTKIYKPDKSILRKDRKCGYIIPEERRGEVPKL